jgi:FKBP-type peptidyl-prolyl cis-trans isomerase 2
MPEEKSKKKTTKKTKKTTKAKKAVEDVVEQGSLIYVDYVGRTKDDGKVFDLTLEDVAKEEGLYKEDGYYEPMLVAVGWNWMLQALEEDLVGMKVGESKRIEVPPEKGAGVRDSSKIKQIAQTRLRKQGIRPMIGEEVKIGNERGIITHVFGRTARVDFNSPLAGKTLVFDVTVREIITDLDEKLFAVVKRRLPTLTKEEVDVSVKSKVIWIELPLRTRYIESVQYAEIGIAMDALKVYEDAKEVKIMVTWPRPEPPPSENIT